MRKIILITFALLASVQFAFAQQAIAKIKYEEAEEAYSINDFETTLTKLNEVEALLESTNPKVMYLKIMTQFKIIERNSLNEFKVIENARQLCTKYLNDYENVPNNDDKYLDIYKIIEVLKKYPDNETKLVALYSNRKSGNQYMYGTDGQTINYTEALKYYTQAADQGDIPSKAEIGRIYNNGLGVPKDDKKSFIYLKEAADRGNAVGQNGLGALYYFGWGVEQDLIKAIKLFELASNQGNLRALYNLGRAYYIGKGVILNYGQSFKYFKLAADKGFPAAQNDLGVWYFSGANGVIIDRNLALKYLKMSADQNDSNGQLQLGIIYSQEYEGKIDFVNAIKYTRLSANQGNPQAQFNLGSMYQKGLGVKKDKDEAKIWFQKAAAQGYQPANNISVSPSASQKTGSTFKRKLLGIGIIWIGIVGISAILLQLR